MNRHAPAAMTVLAFAATLASAYALADPRGIGEPPPPLTPELIEARRAKLAEEMADWLLRMVGRFKVEGVADFGASKQAVQGATDSGTSSLEGGEGTATSDEGTPSDPLKVKSAGGTADCVPVGKGPGVHCLFFVTWAPEWTPQGGPVEGGEPFLAPAMKLFGLDRNTPVIMQLQLDTDGVAELESASLKGNTVKWIYETRCESDTHADSRCRRVTRIYTAAGSNRIQVTIEFEKWNSSQADWLPESSFNLDMLRAVEDQPGAMSMPGITGIR
jgi:hypothetical protein